MRKIVFFILLSITSLSTQASLLVTPSRLAFDEKDRTQEVILVNSANTPKSYRLEFTNMKQDPNGGYKKMTEEELNKFPRADQFLRFSPRRVTLQPGESQKIKVMVRRSKNMNEPEYRSHLRFTALPDELVGQAATTDSSGGVTMKLNLLLSYSIPVVLRTEKPSTKVNISDIKFIEGDKQQVTFSLNKQSDNSLHGDFTVFHQLDGNETEVAYLNSFNIYRETNTQFITIPMFRPLQNKSGTIRIEYKGKAEFSDIELANGEISL